MPGVVRVRVYGLVRRDRSRLPVPSRAVLPVLFGLSSTDFVSLETILLLIHHLPARRADSLGDGFGADGGCTDTADEGLGAVDGE